MTRTMAHAGRRRHRAGCGARPQSSARPFSPEARDRRDEQQTKRGLAASSSGRSCGNHDPGRAGGSCDQRRAPGGFPACKNHSPPRGWRLKNAPICPSPPLPTQQHVSAATKNPGGHPGAIVASARLLARRCPRIAQATVGAHPAPPRRARPSQDIGGNSGPASSEIGRAGGLPRRAGSARSGLTRSQDARIRPTMSASPTLS